MTQNEIIRMAREALKKAREMIGYPANMVLYEEELALREALAEQAEGAIVKTCPDGYGTITTEQAEQEPVAWMTRNVPVTPNWKSTVNSSETALYCKPLYAAPVRTKNLTDGELTAIWERNAGDWLACFRAVIAADREKNK